VRPAETLLTHFARLSQQEAGKEPRSIEGGKGTVQIQFRPDPLAD